MKGKKYTKVGVGVGLGPGVRPRRVARRRGVKEDHQGNRDDLVSTLATVLGCYGGSGEGGKGAGGPGVLGPPTGGATRASEVISSQCSLEGPRRTHPWGRGRGEGSTGEKSQCFGPLAPSVGAPRGVRGM